jgi:hypothetical protein
MKTFLMIAILMTSFTVQAQENSGIPLPNSGNVTLPLSEYNKLVELANKPVVKPEVPPVPYAIKRANIKLKLGSDSLLGTVQCDGELFTKGITKVPLAGAPPVFDATQGGKALPLEQSNGVQNAILSGPAEFSIMFDTGIPLNVETGRASFFLPVPMAGAAQLSLEIPGEHTNVAIAPGLITSRSSNNGRTIVEATLVPGQPVRAWWTTREIAAPVVPREVRFLSAVKTLVSVSEADLKLTVLADISVIQGDPAQFEMTIPQGYEMTGVTGASLESETMQSGSLILKIDGTGKRTYQFLISLEKPLSAAKADIPFISVKGAQRETGEILVEGEGTMELSATEGGALKRMDIKEVNTYLRSLARHPQHAAFRFHRQPSDLPTLALSWNRFQDSSVLAAVAELAEVTTLITSEGRSLTEVKLVVKNQAKPFLKVGLPTGASILTAEVSGEKVKPVQGQDGIRVPLLRTGFRPSGPYKVAFVFMHAGNPFNKKGNSELSLPPMDIPISFLHWEVFLPEMYQVKNFDGNALETEMLPPSAQARNYSNDTLDLTKVMGGVSQLNPELVGEFKMVLAPVDVEMGRGMAQVQILTKSGTNSESNPIFSNSDQSFAGVNSENINLQRDGISINEVRSNSAMSAPPPPRRATREVSSNVADFQQRVAGVLPIHVDVPHAGNSYRFIRPLVLNEETKVSFRYKSK